MSSVQRRTSSGSESDPRYAQMDEKKRKRMISNRESARRSRMKKQKQMGDLANEITQLEKANAVLRQNIAATSQLYVELESANNVLRAQTLELTDGLQSLNSVLQIWDEISGLNVEIPEMPDPLMNRARQPIMASADVFQM